MNEQMNKKKPLTKQRIGKTNKTTNLTKKKWGEKYLKINSQIDKLLSLMFFPLVSKQKGR